jgi:hypothetical protein
MNNQYIRVLIDEVVETEKNLKKYLEQYPHEDINGPLYKERIIQRKKYEQDYVSSITKLGNYIYKNQIDFVELLRKKENLDNA